MSTYAADTLNRRVWVAGVPGGNGIWPIATPGYGGWIVSTDLMMI